MAEYWFKLKGEYEYGSETIRFHGANLKSDKQARAYAIAMIKEEKRIPARAYVEIRKVTAKSYNTIPVGDVTSYKPVGSNRIYKYITYGMLAKGIYDPRPLNQDGSFRGAIKKKKSAPFGL